MKYSACARFSLLSALLAVMVLPSVAQQPARPSGPKPTAQIQAVLDEASTAERANRLEDAEKLYAKAVESARAISDRKGESFALYRLGGVKTRRNQFAGVIEIYEQSIAISRAIMDQSGEADSSTSLGILYSRTGQPKKGLEFFEKSLILFRALGDRNSEAQSLSRIAYAYNETDQEEKSLEFFQRALAIHRETGSKRGEAVVQNGLAGIYRTQGKYELAVECFQQALAYFRTIDDKYSIATILGNMGAVHLDLRKYPESRIYGEEALVLWQAVGENSGIANTLHLLGKLAEKRGEPAGAQAYYEKALPLVKASGNRRYEAKYLRDLGLVEVQQGKLEGALQHFATAVGIVESIRSNLAGNTESQSTYLVSKLPYYYDYLRTLLGLGRYSEAFDLAQKTKARSLLDLLALGRVDLNRSLTPEERQQELELRRQADALNASMVKEGVENEVGSKKRYTALKEELQGVERKLQILIDTLNSRHPGLDQKRVAKTTTLAELSKKLPTDTGVLDYVVVAKDDVRLFVITRSGGTPKLSVYQVSKNYSALSTQAQRFHAACSNPRKAYLPDAQALYRALLKPAESQLRGVKRLVICPDGALWDIPFQALAPSEARSFVGEKYEIAYAYSATGAQASLALSAKRVAAQARSILVAANPAFGSAERFGDLKEIPGQRPIESASRPIESAARPVESASRPIDLPDRAFEAASRTFESASRAIESASRGKAIRTLPGTQREADVLKRLFPDARVLTSGQAQESTVKEHAGRYRYLHFATHGFVNDGSPLLSSVVMAKPGGQGSEDGFLTAREIYGLNLNAEMTVLSACNTARGENRTGEGVIGLTWALFVAGCPTQVVSQWAVDDASTALLMGRFYENLAKRRMGKAQALTEAEGWLRKQNPKYAHPYYWAPFVLYGAWK